MSKNKTILLMLAKGGTSQADIAAILHVSKRDVSAAAKAIREFKLTYDAIDSMGEDLIDDTFFPKERRGPNDAYLQPDMAALVERKKKNRKLPVKLFWLEYREVAEKEDKLAYSYQTFCEMFAEVAERTGATRHFVHEPGAKCYIDWCGDVAYLTDKLLGIKTKVYVLVVCLPFSGKFWAEGFCDMRQKSWQDGQAHAFEAFGGVPRMAIPDNCATAVDRAKEPITLVNAEYGRFMEHYGAAIVPARVRRPRDKSLAESTVNMVEQWVIGPANETTFYTLEEFNEFCAEKVDWLNSRPFSAKDGSRDEVFEDEERACLLPLPAERYEMCEWRSAKVSPDYHVQVDYMRYSVPFGLVGKTVDIKMSAMTVTILHGGEAVATHPRLHGRRGQYSTNRDHMPEGHAALDSPWSEERFRSWAERIGPETSAAVCRVLSSRAVVEQAFVPCRNILGLSKTYGPELLEQACAKMNSAAAVPSYSGLKNAIQAIKAQAAGQRRPAVGVDGALVDRAKSAGRLRGAEAYRRGGRR